jgi:peptidoglycan/xylan/chitin deacetylase (PgdA/CDA1 family)
MYHVIGVAPPGAPFPELYVTPDMFRAQLAALAAADYHAVTLDKVWGYWHGRPLPTHPVVLTFDDGYRGDYSVAMPALARRGWPGVLDLIVANLHRHGWGLRTWEVRRMVQHGWQIASHTLTHPDLTTLDTPTLRREVTASRAVLRRAFGQPVDWFCYPLGRFNPTVERAVRAAGYVGALTELPGLATPHARWLEPRIRVAASTTPAELVAAIADTSGPQ